MPEKLARKAGALTEWFTQFSKVIVSFSGGVDSSLVAFAARRVLGRDSALAVVADSPSLARRELAEAEAFARQYDIELRVIGTREGDDPGYVANEGDRCYFCKLELYTVLSEIVESDGFETIVSGTNADDTGDYRPGLKAAEEQKVRNPLLETGFTKDDVRALSRALGLQTWDKPALACLASRIPHGEPVTEEKLLRIEAAEEVLWNEGFSVFRVRHHGTLGRLEIGEDEIHRFDDGELKARILEGVRRAGFDEVMLDPEPYRSGRLNEMLETGEEGD
jgi:uncharacterized protein